MAFDGCTPMNHAAHTQLVTRHAAAAKLSVSLRTIDSLLASGRLAHVRIGRAIRFDLADLDSFLTRHKVNAKAQPTE